MKEEDKQSEISSEQAHINALSKVERELVGVQRSITSLTIHLEEKDELSNKYRLALALVFSANTLTLLYFWLG